MQNIKSIIFILLILIAAFLSCKKESMQSESETEFITVAGFTYGKYNGEWYYVSDGEKTDRVILDRLVVQPKPGIDMYNYNFQASGVPTLPIVSEILATFYVLDMSGLDDPFDAAIKLWNTGNFESMQFDAYGTRL